MVVCDVKSSKRQVLFNSRGAPHGEQVHYTPVLFHIWLPLCAPSPIKIASLLTKTMCLSTQRLYLKVEICRRLSSWRDEDIDFTQLLKQIWVKCSAIAVSKGSLYWITWVNDVLIGVILGLMELSRSVLSLESPHADNWVASALSGFAPCLFASNCTSCKGQQLLRATRTIKA